MSDKMDDYLRKTAGGDRQLASWLGLAVKAPANADELRFEFDEVARNSTLPGVRQVRDKIEVLCEWLKAERKRGAGWISNTDELGRPKRLLVRGFEAHFNAAKKWYMRVWRQMPGNLVVKAQDPSSWGKFSKKPQEEFYRDLVQGMPLGTHVHLHLDRNGLISSLDIEQRNLVTGRQDFYFNRSEDVGKTIYQGGAFVLERLQKKGLAKAVNRNLFALYREMGIQQIELHAGEVGVYAWARTGFVPSQRSWKKLRENVSARLDYIAACPGPEGPLPQSYMDALKGVLKQDDPKNFWFIVDQRHKCHGVAMGKLLTLDWKEIGAAELAAQAEQAGRQDLIKPAGWAGTFDFSDTDCVARMDAYIQPVPVNNVRPEMAKKEKAYGAKL